MTAPTFTSITPSTGHPGGKYLAVIEGTGFQQHPDPPADGYVGGTFESSMEVEINGVQATDVRVYSTTRLTCIMPRYRGAPALLATGLDVDVTLRNLGPPPEEVTEVDAFTYARTNLARGDGAIARVSRELLEEMQRQILMNVALNTSTDYDSATGDGLSIVEVAEAPGIVLEGPRLAENKLYRKVVGTVVRASETGPSEYARYREHWCVDLNFRVSIVAKDDPAELLNLMQEYGLFFRTNPYLELDADPGDPAAGVVRLGLWQLAEPAAEGGSNRDNLFLARGEAQIRGVPVDRDSWLQHGWGTILGDPPDLDLESEAY